MPASFSARRPLNAILIVSMTLEEMRSWGTNTLPGLVGFEILEAAPGRLLAQMAVRRDLLAPNGYLHAASVIALADTASGYGTMFDLPNGANGFTTIELKTNFTGTARNGIVACEATRAHKGRTTQVWDAIVTERANGRQIALFRCTQMILYKSNSSPERV
jgi:uncharacterized protein (TIGR00369 family)